uniref:Uncharacterized protein n=1 Tax=Oryza nivara TaxID=4536 RepID=A0A0E0H3N4_ORYNI
MPLLGSWQRHGGFLCVWPVPFIAMVKMATKDEGAADAWESGWKRFSSTAAAEVSDDGPWGGDELGVQEVEEDPEDGGGPRGGRGLGIQRSGNGSCRPAFGWLVLAGTTDESGLNQATFGINSYKANEDGINGGSQR